MRVWCLDRSGGRLVRPRPIIPACTRVCAPVTRFGLCGLISLRRVVLSRDIKLWPLTMVAMMMSAAVRIAGLLDWCLDVASRIVTARTSTIYCQLFAGWITSGLHRGGCVCHGHTSSSTMVRGVCVRLGYGRADDLSYD